MSRITRDQVLTAIVIVVVLGLVAFALMLALLGLGQAVAGSAAVYRHAPEDQRIFLPDPVVTPGKIALGARASVCGVKWGRDVRHVTQKMKLEVCAAYGARNCPGPRWEVDHLVSRELGGADDVANLWPQPIAQARQKDWLENTLHRRVCAGALPLHDAQEAIRSDWYTTYLKMKEGTK